MRFEVDHSRTAESHLQNPSCYGGEMRSVAAIVLILISSFAGGEVFRSGCTFRRGAGKVFYFRPGHETYPTYYHPGVLRVITNAVRWAVPTGSMTMGAVQKPEMGWFLRSGPDS